MKIGIHPGKHSFNERWIAFCEKNQVSYKIVDCYRSDIIRQLDDCDALMWHFSQNDPKAILFAKELLYSIQLSGKRVFPDFNTIWHFDDKIGQKYLLEAIGAPFAPTWIFYDKREAINWVDNTVFPKVFKLRGGAGSQNVSLIRNREEAIRIIKKAFGKGFTAYNPMRSLKERYRKFRLGQTNLEDVLEGLVRFMILPPYSRTRGREKGYAYFQEFIPGNDHDIRVIIIGDKAFAIKRMVRENDFRASGSGIILYDHKLIDESKIQLSFKLAEKLKSQCVAFDYLQFENKNILVEISYGFTTEGYDSCPGYWDQNLKWNEGKFNPYGWMVENLLGRE